MTAPVIYLDWNATTPPHPAVIEAMVEASHSSWGNPSSVHTLGRHAKEQIEVVRANLARSLGAHPRDVLFTSGGTEANNLALMDAVGLVTSRLEHPSITRAAEALMTRGVPVKWLPVTRQGQIDCSNLDTLLSELPQGTCVAVQAVNHETGVVQPLAAVAEVVTRRGALLHIDAVQAVGKLEPSEWLHGDSYAVAAHKLRGPKGIGAFVFRCGRKAPKPLLFGGSQQRGFRPGTIDPLAVVGFGAAWKRVEGGPERHRALRPLRDRLEQSVSAQLLPNVESGPGAPGRLSHVASLYCPTCTGEELVAALDLEGICVSSGSACSAGTAEPSPVILAMHSDERASRTIRVSLGETTTNEDIDRTIRAIGLVLAR